MMAKELRQNLRRGFFVYPFLGIQLLGVLATAVEFFQPGRYFAPLGSTEVLDFDPWNSGPLWAMAATVCAILMPFAGLFLMREEVEESNHELLLLTRVTRWAVVVGKFFTLWGLCALTFISLLPYVVARYVIGSVEFWHETGLAVLTLGIAAVVCAGTIAASGFPHIAMKLWALVIYFFSAFICGMASAVGGFGFNSVVVVVMYVALGLAVARSRMRLVTFGHEMHPSGRLLWLIVLAPVAALMCGLWTDWDFWSLGLIPVFFLARRVDRMPRDSEREPRTWPDLV